MVSGSLSYPIRYIIVTCLVVYVDLRFIFKISFSPFLFVLVLVLFCSVLFLKSCCGLFLAEMFSCMAADLLLFFYSDSIETVSKCLWPCSLYGKDIIHHVKQEKYLLYFSIFI